MRFFFDIFDGDHWTRDDFGVDCGDFQQARHQGVLALTEMAREYFPFGDIPMRLIIRIRNVNRLQQDYELSFCSDGMAAPA
jgi:hypothetical protein